MTYKKMILGELQTSPKGLTCAEIVDWIRVAYQKEGDKNRRQQMSTISGILHKMWKRGEIGTYQYRKGPRGGTVYILEK